MKVGRVVDHCDLAFFASLFTKLSSDASLKSTRSGKRYLFFLLLYLVLL